MRRCRRCTHTHTHTHTRAHPSRYDITGQRESHAGNQIPYKTENELEKNEDKLLENSAILRYFQKQPFGLYSVCMADPDLEDYDKHEEISFTEDEKESVMNPSLVQKACARERWPKYNLCGD